MQARSMPLDIFHKRASNVYIAWRGHEPNRKSRRGGEKGKEAEWAVRVPAALYGRHMAVMWPGESGSEGWMSQRKMALPAKTPEPRCRAGSPV